ncbi:MAG TPA: NUDIX hydrolase [Candidatus Brachybacterium merdigallinarum]|nr:NUDIX hydrolase [Candidatus Brachybacterium merdigallinarum]
MTAVPEPVLLAVDLVILTLREGRLNVLLIERQEDPYGGSWALPGGFVGHDEDIADAAHRVLAEEADLGSQAVHLEQVQVFAAPGRDPRGRVVSVTSMALGADLPDPRRGSEVADARWWPVADHAGIRLAFDHEHMLEVAVEQARTQLEHSALALSFLPEKFTISQLRGVYESVWGTMLDPGNFHRKVTRTTDFVIELDEHAAPTGGRPARLYRAGDGSALFPPLLRSE